MEQEIETKPNRKTVAAVTLDPAFQARVAEIAAEKEWSLAKTGGWLIRLGLQKHDEQLVQSQGQGARIEAAAA